ncbi:hypothetical protein MSG28_008989 [Choristoneura fumiferana]|uniref:Uncharacterized protein n=1 Tax=Choristoneura fumiferana TaxID=7141 RepID=A0ACC0J8R7_CHOFU|nr:hypothetical protein MSG28_008989 [Choristoneura fumiferana]
MCVSPAERASWEYSKSIKNLSFTPLEDKDTIVEERDALLIYNAATDDAGVYSCQIGSSVSGLVLLEVVDDDYNVVKPETSHGPYASPPRTLDNQGLTVFSSWAPWSECSTCGGVGRRRRYGMCYVKIAENKADNGTNKGEQLLTEDTKIFEDFPGGLPCRSENLPASLLSIPEVRGRRNEIMMGLCKIPCKNTSKQDLDVFLTQRPSIARNIVFARAGQTVKLQCPGTTLVDQPPSWRVLGARAAARALAAGSGGRASIDARDRLVLAPAVPADTDVYRPVSNSTIGSKQA